MGITIEQAKQMQARVAQGRKKKGKRKDKIKKFEQAPEEKKDKPNKRVMGAKRVRREGIKFDSQLEAYFYDHIEEWLLNGSAEWKPGAVQLGETRDKDGKLFSKIRWYPDSLFTGVAYVDPKGWPTPEFKDCHYQYSCQ